jgi:hypothetical protein
MTVIAVGLAAGLIGAVAAMGLMVLVVALLEPNEDE